jgi:hypothetical protein
VTRDARCRTRLPATVLATSGRSDELREAALTVALELLRGA